MSDLETLEEAARKANAAASAERGRLHDAENAAVVGKHFKYRNCYSCPERPSDYWWLYLRVIEAKGGRLKCFAFEIDKYGKISVETKNSLYHVRDGYRPISAKEYRRAWDALMAKLKKAAP